MASDSFNAKALWRAGQLLIENDRFEAAVSALWRATKRKPTDATYLTALAEALVNLGRNDEALREMTKAVALDPSDYSAQGVLAKVQQNLERPEAAIESWRTALRLSPQDPVLRRALVTTLIYTGRPEEAKAVAQEGIKLVPSSPRMYDALGLAYWGGGQFDSALVLFRRGTEMTSNVAWRWWNYSHSVRLLGQMAEAERAIGRIRDLGGSAEMAEASQLQWMGKHDQAAAIYRRGTRTDSVSTTLLNYLAYAELNAGQYDSAVAVASRLDSINPYQANNLGNLTIGLSMLGKPAEAVKVADRARARQPMDQHIMALQVWIYGRSGKEAQAKVMHDSLMTRMQRYTPSLIPRVIAQLGVGDTTGARATFAAAVAKRDETFLKMTLDDPVFGGLAKTPEMAEAKRAFRQAGDQ
ncbi:MAG TPA: tetratricopeptide repeat protein [Gemmatimonadales bacterium]|nr:tetratricopeptide repeat protein [Gemmatimonadales bacterium]